MNVKKFLLAALASLLTLSACVHQSEQARDIKADEKLRVEKPAEVPEADQALLDFQEKEEQNRRRDLERQITDPFQ